MSVRIALGAMIVAGLFGCGGSGGSTVQPSAPVTTVPADEGRATFTLQGADYNNVTNSFSSANGNLVFCRRESPFPNTIWIRMAQSRVADGEASPHVDIDLCNFAGSGTYTAVHDITQPRTCSQGRTHAIWWHETPTKVLVSRPTSQSCSVSVTQTPGFIEGTFQCSGLTAESGSFPNVDIPSGSFRCNFS
jgi:hypothetical protein